MALSNLTKGAVEKAIAEFKSLGREVFLGQYGFGEARSYFIIDDDGNRYDSKAIAGVAHKYIGEGSEPLRNINFSGGEKATARVLRELGFTVLNIVPKNPDWVRDELILAMDFYLQHREAIPDKSSEEIAKFSDEINALGLRLGLAGGETFRNPNGVYMKLMNFRRLDPHYTGTGKVGLQRGGKSEEIVWAEFYHDQAKLREVAAAIRSFLSDDTDEDPTDELESEGVEEGGVLERTHRSRERNRKLIKEKKKGFIRKHGRLFCEACQFDFRMRYGERGDGVIDCHHTKPVSTLRPGDRTLLVDLRLLCANCHRIVHAKGKWLTFEELMTLVGPSSAQ